MDTIGFSITTLHFNTTFSTETITLGVKKGVVFAWFHPFSLLISLSAIPCFAPDEKQKRKTKETFNRPAEKQHKSTPQTPKHQKTDPKNTRENKPRKNRLPRETTQNQTPPLLP
jgi:hypothetical protein